ncbi:hypothetical protein HHK36_027821 [Tetracentron sinense]|uniref:RanBD1 domain-containing protein n=1 Tax=Tetracentron sinense TaxID=13715 RepID=A0A835D1K5_TETSI|nr:hypothetical protein HHK36_027821 [Tetracentron sinense]
MKGTKRFGHSDSNPDTNDSAFRSKRIMAASLFDVHRAEPSRRHLMAEPPLDVHRAESSRQHVRALNTQFASWVQSQLQNHPDELWEDGIQDYIDHASNIMDKFRDVVNWLKENAAKAEGLSIVGSHYPEKKLVPETTNNKTKLFQEKSGFATAGSTASFATSWSSSLLPNSNSQTPFMFGNQNSVPLNHEASADLDGENDLEQPSSPSVKKTEEKGIIVIHEVKCKLYVKLNLFRWLILVFFSCIQSNDPADKDAWKDKGMGQLSIRCKEDASKATKESKPTIVVRNDVGKVLLNALLYPGIKTNLQKNSVVAIFHTSGGTSGNDSGKGDSVVARTYLIRTKTEEERNKLAKAIQEHTPAA